MESLISPKSTRNHLLFFHNLSLPAAFFVFFFHSVTFSFPTHLFLTKEERHRERSRSNLSRWWCFPSFFVIEGDGERKTWPNFRSQKKSCEIPFYLLIDRLLNLIESRTCNLSPCHLSRRRWHEFERFFITTRWYLFPAFLEIASWILIPSCILSTPPIKFSSWETFPEIFIGVYFSSARLKTAEQVIRLRRASKGPGIMQNTFRLITPGMSELVNYRTETEWARERRGKFSILDQYFKKRFATKTSDVARPPTLLAD